MTDQTTILPSNTIDKQQWDDCIARSASPLIYAYSYYLDHIADNWSGIIINDYDAVMPICWRKKAGIKYSYDVPFVQQLGLFQKNNRYNQETILQYFFSFCKYGDYCFNYTFNYQLEGLEKRTNFILDLSKSYKSIQAAYKADLINNLKKATKERFIFSEADYVTAITQYKNLYRERMPHILEHDFNNFKKLCSYLFKEDKLVVRKVSTESDRLLAIALLLKDNNRFYNIMNSTTDAGRRSGANHYLFDNIIREFAGSNLMLDLEGSDIPGVKSFYKKFGAVNQPYSWLHFNKLPFPLNKLKR